MYLTTICGREIEVDDDTYEKYHRYTWRIINGDTVVTSQKVDGIREVPLKRLVLSGSSEVTRRKIYFQDDNSFNLRLSNLSYTNVAIEKVEDYLICTLPNNRRFMVDAVFYETILSRAWHISGNRYVTCNEIGGKQHYLHRLVFENIPKGKIVDHMNGDVLDNRSLNLRLCSPGENSMNRVGNAMSDVRSSLYKGVSKNKGGSFKVRVKLRSFGSYSSETIAANVYNHHAKEVFGEYVWLNDVEYAPIEDCLKYRV